MRIRPQINATNIFNRKYFTDAQDGSFIPTHPPYTAINALYGAPREITAEVGVDL
jgi:outer membrane receptor protein involved in Fe transport